MSKKVQAKTRKKKNYRLRKSVRRTLGALLMISAIIVAAIPFPDAAAADPGAGGSGGSAPGTTASTSLNYQVTADSEINKVNGTKVDLSKPGNKEFYTLRMLDSGVWRYEKQFDYYTITTPTTGAILSDYNDLYSVADLTLQGTINSGEYLNIDKTLYDAYFTALNSKTLRYDELNTEEGIKFKYFFPTKYKELEDGKGSPTEVTASATEVDTLKRGAYYCEYEGITVGAGKVKFTGTVSNSVYKPAYTLGEAEKPKTGTAGGVDVIYILKTVDKNTQVPSGYRADNNGFVFSILNSSYDLIGIGDNAFKGVTNGITLTLPSTLLYIGDNAFEGSYVEKITLTNVKDVGNYAFKNSRLQQVEFSRATLRIGTEAFYGTRLTNVSFPFSINSIGEGAFANNDVLSTLSFDATSALEIKQFAFYNCPALASLDLTDEEIITIGTGAFALGVVDSGTLTSIKLPKGLTSVQTKKDESGLADYVFYGRTALQTVVMPRNLGYTAPVTLLGNLLANCTGLSYVEFPETCRYTLFPDTLFSSVTNANFYVKGPKLDGSNQVAGPRKSTWACTMSGNVSVPYVYTENGVDYYEVKSDAYLITSNVNKSKKEATVTNCILVDPLNPPSDGKLNIPDYVGPYKVVKLGDGCIEQSVKDTIKELIIGNSIVEIGDQVFMDCKNMSTLEIGDGVKFIGKEAFQGCTSLTKATIGSGLTQLKDRAFEGCKTLVEIEFKTPAGGAASFPLKNIGTDALATGSNKLTITGIIDKVYGPFAYSMDAGNYVDKTLGIRICYKSPDPTCLTVILDNRNNFPTLVDYPKYEDLKNVMVDDVDTSGNPIGTKTNLKEKYESGKPLTPAEEALINATLYLDIPDGIDSIDVRGYLKSTSRQTVNEGQEVTNRYSVAAYFSDAGTYKYKTQYENYGLFNGGLTDGSVVEKEERGDDNIRSITMHSVRYLPTVSQEDLDRLGTDIPVMSGGAFYSCENLQMVSLGAAMEDVGELPFLACTSLNSISSETPKFICNNKVLYENITQNSDGEAVTGKKIVECLATRGNAGDSVVNVETDPTLSEVVEIADGAFMRCDNLGTVDLSGTPNTLKTIPTNCFMDNSGLVEVTLPSNIRIIEEGAFENTADNIRVTILGREVDLKTSAFKGNKAIVRTYKDTAAYNAAMGIPNVTVIPIEDTFRVAFYNSVDGSIIKVDYVEEGKRADAPEGDEIPKVAGMKFTGWSTDEYKNVTKDLVVLALYASDGTGGTGGNGGTGGGTGGTGGNGGTGGGNGTGGTDVNGGVDTDGDGIADYDKDGNKLYTLTVTNGTGSGRYKAGARVSIAANAASAGSTFANWTSSNTNVIFEDSTKATTTLVMPAGDATVIANYAGQYTLEVKYGSGSGSYPAGAKVTISAVEAPAGKQFSRWSSSTSSLTIASSTSSTTTITMPASNATVEALYSNTATGGSTGTGSASTTGASSTNKTSIVITRPGISDTDQASAYVSGSSDGFVVKISQSAEADEAALAALEAEYGDMTPIKFAAMDISLYDATGTTKITDTTGLKVNITMPIPDALRSYAGNNKIAGIVNGSLDKLGVKFITMNGIPCMSFTATHFSPYVVYVDTGNLVAGDILDQTPKTGDGIHPKWFLSIGLASISMVLFLKRDSKYKTKLS